MPRRVTFRSKSQLYPELGATYLTSLKLNFCSSESQDTLPCGAGMWVVGVMGRAPQHCKFFSSPEGGSPKVGRGWAVFPASVRGLLPSLCAHLPPNLLFLPGHGQIGVGLTSATFLNLNHLLKYLVSTHNHTERCWGSDLRTRIPIGDPIQRIPGTEEVNEG